MFERTDKGLGDFPKTLKDGPDPNWQDCQFLGLENLLKIVRWYHLAMLASLKSIEGMEQVVKKIGKDNL